MHRITLSLDDELFLSLEKDAIKNNCTPNVQIVSILEKLYRQTPFDYGAALNRLVNDVKNVPVNQEFALNALPSFKDISVAEARNSKIRPSAVRARLGRMFNEMARKGMINGVEACPVKKNSKSTSKAAVYRKVAQA